MRLLVRALTAVVVLGAPACDLANNASDLGTTLTDPEAGTLDVPGRKLTEGRFRSLAYASSDQSGGRVLTLSDRDGESHLAITSFVDGTTCDAGPAAKVRALSYESNWTFPELVSCESAPDEQGKRSIRFVDLACGDQLQPLVDAEWVEGVLPGNMDPRGRLVLSKKKLFFLNLAERSLTEVAEDVSYVRVLVGGQGRVRRVWVVRAGKLVAFDAELSQVAEFGQDVDSVNLTYGEPLVYSDARGVHAVYAEDDSLVEKAIAPEGCRPIVLDSEHIVYFDPCEERRLQVWMRNPPDLGAMPSGVEPVTIELPGHAIQSGHVFPWSQYLDGKLDHLQFTYLTSEDPEAATGELWLAGFTPSGELLPARRLEERATFEPNGLQLSRDTVMVDWDGTVGRLLHVRIQEREFDEHPYAEVARDVRYADPMLALANFRDGVGDLVYYSNWSRAQPALTLGHDVPEQDLWGSRAFVGDYDGRVGTLYTLGFPEGVITATPFLEHVVPSSYLELKEEGLALYRAAPFRGGGATLHARLVDAELDLVVNGGVTEMLDITWPTPGLLYLVDDGDESGIWFSAAR